MKNKAKILCHIAYHRFELDIRRRKKKKKNRKNEQEKLNKKRSRFGKNATVESIIQDVFSDSTKYLLETLESPVSYSNILAEKDDYGSVIKIPVHFSLIENPSESYNAIVKILASSLYHRNSEVVIDYSACNTFTLDAQILLDIVLKDILACYKVFGLYKKLRKYRRDIIDRSIGGSNVRTMLFSVGSQAIHANKKKEFPNVIPYNLCMHKATNDSIIQAEQKELDTTSLSDYVDLCLRRMGRELDGDRWDDLCTVIGEILINAEEHSSTKCRYSIGYFEEIELNGEKVGKFQLVILNLGRSIYEKFHDEDCPNKDVIMKMKGLSDKYTRRGLFKRKKFEEEALWTLYSLQDGVTSVSPQQYSQRGNGSLRFIESFLNLKNSKQADNVSKMILQSGKTRITFDGTYGTSERLVKNEKYRVMAFNQSNNIEEMPDTKYVEITEHYFPGTFISAQIIF